MTSRTSRWQFFIDRGGTFTDCLGRDPASPEVRATKVLSSDRAPLEGIRRLLGLAEHEPIPPCDVRMGTTLATNALLERKGVPTALLISEGFEDLLAIGDQTRPDLFALDIVKPELLYAAVLELPARCDRDGGVLSEPDEADARARLRALRDQGIDSIAVVFMHAYRAGELERRIGAWAREEGFRHVSLSHEVAAEIGLLGRGETSVVDAYLTPLIADYVRTLSAELPGSRLRLMQSSGGLRDAGAFRGRDAILSGPAGGAVAVARIADQLALGPVIGLDMGGTSTDVTRYAGELERVYETKVAGVRLRVPMTGVHTVAAGGGSICRYDGRRLRVGPDSAGARPGPLCYGRADAHELALTDVNLVLGRLVADRFPFALDTGRALFGLQTFADALAAQGDTRGVHGVAQGFFDIAIEHMAEAIHRVSVGRGHDVREHTLIAFGGAAGQHACALARRLAMRRIVVHPLSGVLSAWGIGHADDAWHGEQDAGRHVLADALPAADHVVLDALTAKGGAQLQAEGNDATRIVVEHRVDLRYRGSETAITVPLHEDAALRAAFETLHQQRFGYIRPEHPIEVVTLRVEVRAPAEPQRGSVSATGAGVRGAPLRTSTLWIEGRALQVPVLARESLPPDGALQGPAIVIDDTGTIVLEPGFELTVGPEGAVVLTDQRGVQRAAPTSGELDPVRLEVFDNLFASIAEQMGIVLRHTALSTNIRERLDFSCALFDANGGLVANAPHIPVHLGAMSESVRAVIAMHADMQPGDVFATNDPALGGSHLPDVTAVTPVFDAAGALQFLTACRGHHADIGGITPGSMPPFSTRLEEEGAVLHALRIVRAGRLDEAAIRAALGAGPYPARDPDTNLLDLQAQVAANQKGVALLTALFERFGASAVSAYMRHVQDNAAAAVRDAIAALPDGEHAFEDGMDDGTRIAVRVRIAGAHMAIDFTGSSAQVAGNLNAPRAVTVAAVLYVLRVLAGTSIPLNGGCLQPITLRIPEGSVLSPGPDAAVVAGNVETSQRVVDVLLGALGKLAACQGTMNNLALGDDSFGYYETIAGGAGASAQHDGCSGVHTHMTNTRITDPEVLEAVYPLRLLRFALRRGSGGAGRHRGGDGLVRELQALASLRATILSERRTTAPFGLRGGERGASGRNFHNGQPVGGRAEIMLAANDILRIETPGGGGYGDV